MHPKSSPVFQNSAASPKCRERIGIAVLLALLVWSAGCGLTVPSSSSSIPENSDVKIAISPASSIMSSGATQQFVATLRSTADTAVTWKTSAGSISSTGLFTAPSVTSSTQVTITAFSGASGAIRTLGVNNGISNSWNSSSVGVTVVPRQSLAISNESLPAGTSGTPYTASLAANGGVAPYQWRINGSLPQGLSVDSSGLISGIPLQTGTFSFTASVTDSTSQTASGAVALPISSSTSGNFDGPAELPRTYIQSLMADTPAPGAVTLVPAGGNLQTALDDANCGDTIQLQAGATFTGIFTFPAKNCSNSDWIIVRTSSPDSALPVEGTRLTPCYAGVGSLPGRPSFQCASTTNVMAKILMTTSQGSGPIIFANGANHYRLVGLEITRQQGTPVVTSLASIQTQGTMDHIVFDRLWMHGTAQDETTRGIELVGGTFVSIVDSFFTDFHCISKTGSCGDAQAILGGLGSNPMGPYQIDDNFLEASGENILFGGGSATLTPADIEIRRNHMFKPMTWLQGQSGYVGGSNGNPFIVKNLLEIKNAQRVLVDSNIMEDTWGGFTQDGYGIVITPRNQSNGNGGNLCPNCQVTDITVRYSTISHVGGGLEIANPVDGNGAALAGERYSIHDLIIDDINGTKYNGPSDLAEISVGAGAPLLQDATINHLTAFPSSMLFIVGDETGISGEMQNIVFTNSIVNAGTYPVWSTGAGGSANCAYHDSPLTTLNLCMNPYVFLSNAIIAPTSGFPPSSWPAGNSLPASVSAVQFVNYNGGNGGDYHLLPSSPYKGAGTDGKDLGADVDTVLQDIAGVD